MIIGFSVFLGIGDKQIGHVAPNRNPKVRGLVDLCSMWFLFLWLAIKPSSVCDHSIAPGLGNGRDLPIAAVSRVDFQ